MEHLVTGLAQILHVCAVVVLLGNLLMAPFWRKRLAISGGPQARAAANRSVRVADLLFTMPGWIVTLLTGLVLAIKKEAFGKGWLHVSLLLFLVWLWVWHAGTMRARRKMLVEADEAAASGRTETNLAVHERLWARWSYASAVVVILILILMVIQPSFRR